MAELIKVKDLSVGYGERAVIKRASFVVESGDFICVVGANGAGKSTLIKTILGILKPSAGKIQFADKLTQSQLGYLPQDMKFESDFPASVEEVVLTGALGRMGWRPFYGAKERSAALDCMKELKISKLAKRSFAELSGGQRQKVLLARALMASRRVLFLDEPSNNLDYKSKADFYELLKKMNADGLTIMMITHDVDVHDLIGNKVLALRDDGIWFGETAKYLEVIHEHC
jgi:zinc transport system ATP-binding protein